MSPEPAAGRRPAPITALTVSGARMRLALGLAWGAAPCVLVGVVAVSVLAGVLPVVAALLTKLVLDRITGGAGAGGVWVGALALAAAGLGVAAVPPVQRLLQGQLDRSVVVHAKDRLYRAVTGIPLLSTLEAPAFRDRLRMAELASRGGPGQLVQGGVGLGQSTVTLAGLVAAMAVVGPWVAALLVLAAIPALVAEIRLSRRRADLAWRISPAERREVFYAELLTDLSAAKEIRLFGSGRLFRRRMLAELAGTNAEQRRFELRETAVQLTLAVLSAVTVGAIVVGVLLAAADGALTPGDVAAVIVAVSGAQAALAAAVGHISTVHHAGLLLDHYRAVVSDRHEDAPVARDRTDGRGLELDDVWFRYGEDQPWVLRGISATIPPGQAVALVGENGSGKSTLVKLLCRFYDPTRGSIRWDGVDLRELPLEELRRRIGAVFQDFMSYDLSAAENVALGGADGCAELDLAPGPIEDAARAAEVHDAVAQLPRGYRTMLSRMFVDHDVGNDDDDAQGVLLSGGQWQRLALARALLRGRRDMLILDEPSSGLDAEAEHRIHQRIRAHRRGRTSVLVSHRLNTVRDADRIIVLTGGRVVEQGDHAALVAAGGTYARMFAVQAAGYETAPAP